MLAALVALAVVAAAAGVLFFARRNAAVAERRPETAATERPRSESQRPESRAPHPPSRVQAPEVGHEVPRGADAGRAGEAVGTVVARADGIEVVKWTREGAEPTPGSRGEFHLAFPEVRGLASPSVAQRVSEALRPLARPDTMWDRHTSDFQVRLLSRAVLSLTWSQRWEDDGAAHGNTLTTSLTVDLGTGRKLGLQDVLGQPPVTILDIVKEAARRSTRECAAEADRISGLAPDGFYLREDALVFLFGPGEAAAAYCATVELALARDELVTWVEPDGPFRRLLPPRR
jgi:hypothetical protein